jgi:hypothetical protein
MPLSNTPFFGEEGLVPSCSLARIRSAIASIRTGAPCGPPCLHRNRIAVNEKEGIKPSPTDEVGDRELTNANKREGTRPSSTE